MQADRVIPLPGIWMDLYRELHLRFDDPITNNVFQKEVQMDLPATQKIVLLIKICVLLQRNW